MVHRLIEYSIINYNTENTFVDTAIYRLSPLTY